MQAGRCVKQQPQPAIAAAPQKNRTKSCDALPGVRFGQLCLADIEMPEQNCRKNKTHCADDHHLQTREACGAERGAPRNSADGENSTGNCLPAILAQTGYDFAAIANVKQEPW